MSTENVVPFKIVSSRTSASAPLPAIVDGPEAEPMTPEQQENIECIAELCKFLLDNKLSVKNFICCVALSDPSNEDPSYSENHVFATPIHASDFALGLKILENSFFKKLNNGGV